MPRPRKNRGQVSRSDFDSWLKHPITVHLLDWLLNESHTHRTYIGRGVSLPIGASLEHVGREYEKHLVLANEYQKLSSGMLYDRIIPFEKREEDERSESESREGTETSY